MSLAYFGARGTTEESLKQALHIPNQLSKVDVQRYYAIEKSLNQMRSQVSDCVIARFILASSKIYICQGDPRAVYPYTNAEDKPRSSPQGPKGRESWILLADFQDRPVQRNACTDELNYLT